MPPPSKTAIVTGACSGIGLAMTRHLLSKTDTRWHVVLADIREHAYEAIRESLDSDRTTFVKADIGKWEDNARLFKSTYYGQSGADAATTNNDSDFSHPRKIDFFFANAGTGDKELVTQSFDLDAEPAKPDLSCFDVQIGGVCYALKLFIHYTRKARRDLLEEGQTFQTSSFQPKFVITSSMTAQYPFPVAPQYAAGKAALLSLTRSVGHSLIATDGIAVNCIMPGYVATNITPPGLNDAWPKDWITPVQTMARAVDELIDVQGRVEQDRMSDGKDGVIKFAQSVECVIHKLYYRQPVNYVDDSEQFLIEESIKPDGLWSTYIDRAIKETGGIGVSR